MPIAENGFPINGARFARMDASDEGKAKALLVGADPGESKTILERLWEIVVPVCWTKFDTSLVESFSIEISPKEGYLRGIFRDWEEAIFYSAHLSPEQFVKALNLIQVEMGKKRRAAAAVDDRAPADCRSESGSSSGFRYLEPGTCFIPKLLPGCAVGVKMEEKTESACTCTIQDLMTRGCTCGVMAKEKSDSDTQNQAERED